ncbi:MAG: Ig-like domain-containing protein, partial [Gemmatimonadaceae bacterium]|nr:Ig-like domain-containing protein [Gemmatimonadaceae bacterium]
AGVGKLTNKGTIQHVVATPFEVHYAIDVDNQGAMTIPGATVFDKPGGTFVNSGSITGNSAGSLSVVGSILENRSSGVISQGALISDAGGIVRGLGSLSNLSTSNGGRVEPGLPGGALAAASFTNSANGTLEIELGGTQAGIDYDQLNLAGFANFNGTLALVAANGFIAGRCGQAFDIITHASPGNSSTFTAVTGLTPGPGLGLFIVYHITPPKRVSLYGYNPTTVVSVAPNPVSIAEGAVGSQYAICLDHQPTANVTITATPNSQVTVTPSSLVFNAASYYQPQFFTVTAVDDAVVEGNHSGTVAHTATSTDASFNGAAIATLTANIADNDFAPNQPPNATDDAATTPEDQAKVVNVLANDNDPDGDALTVTAVTQPLNGTAAVSGGGNTVTYTPAANYHGGDSFTYTIDDGNAHPVSATVTMTVTPVNDNPVAIDDVGATTAPTAVVVTVLSNDSDVDGDVLSVASVTQPAAGTGTAAISGGGTTVTYTPPAAFGGTATFTYTASDGNGGTASATVTVTVQPRQGPSADLAIAVRLGGDIAHPGFAVALLVTERNLGPGKSPSATITFAAVPGLQFIRAQGGTCTALSNGDVACARGSLSNGATRNTLVVRYKALSAGNYTLSGRISGVRPDPDAANDVASVSFARP